MSGVINEINSHIRDYDFERVCGSVSHTFPIEYEIPHSNTGYLKNQYKINACVSEVICQIAEELWKRQLGENEEHSEGFGYGKYRDNDDYEYGLFLSKAMKCWQTIGTVPKKYFDVFEEVPKIKDIVDKFPELENIAKKYRISGYVNLYSNDKDRVDILVKNALTKYQYGLVAVSNNWFGDSHCIMLTGWNDNNLKYKFKNSWGKEYGNDGYGEIPKSEINAIYLPLIEDIKLPFTDVSQDDWYYKYVKNLYFMGLMKGTSDTTFEPKKYMTRAEVSAMIYRVLKEVDERFDNLNKVINEKIK